MKRFPFIKQKDSMQCGVACLASICEYYGKKYSTQFISKLCSCTPLQVGCSKLRYKSDIKSARIQLVKLLTFNTLHCEIIL